MKTVKLLSVAALLIILFCVKGFAQDGDDNVVGQATTRSESMKTEFGLTDAQTKSVYDLIVSTEQKQSALWTSGKSRMEIEAAKDQIHSDFVSEIKTIFTAEQYAKFDAPETEEGMKEGAKWRVAKMKKELNLTDEQSTSMYDLIVSTDKKKKELNASAKDKTALYEGRIKLDDDFYATVKTILNADQLEKFNKSR